MSRSIRDPAAYQDALRRGERDREVAAWARVAELIAPGRVLEVDGVRWAVRVHRDSLGKVVATASIEGLAEAHAEVLRHERPASDDELAKMLELELRDAIEVRTERLLEVAALMRLARG